SSCSWFSPGRQSAMRRPGAPAEPTPPNVPSLGQGVIRVGPPTVLPVAWTEPVSGGGSVPVVPEILSGPPTWLPLNSTPPWLLVRSTGPEKVLPAHGPVAASPPTSTTPVLPETVSGPASVTPQSRTTVAPVARIGPETIAPARSIAPPGLTV